MSNRISLRQLRAFHAVMISGSLSDAAARLNLTLPAVSKQLTALEHELDIRLFQRQSGRAVRPTSAGIEFFKAVEATISGLNDLQPIAREIVERGRRRIRVAATPPLLNSEPFLKATQQFLKENSDVHIALESRTRLDIEEWVAMRHIEFAIALLPTSNPNLDTYPLVETRAIAAVPRKHTLAKHDVLHPDLVRDHPVILPSRQPIRSRIDAALEQHGHDLAPALESSAAFTCCRMASSGLGIAICDPFSPTSLESRSLVVRAWKPTVELTYGILTPRDVEIDPSARTLIRMVEDHMNQFDLIP